MPAIVTWNHCSNDFVYSTREIFVCSLRKTFGHLSDRAKKIEIDKALTLEHYIINNAFVSSKEIMAFLRIVDFAAIIRKATASKKKK
jgi:hypothetical protein